jgi:hypothetical protein
VWPAYWPRGLRWEYLFCAEILRVRLLGNTSIVSMSTEIFADPDADNGLSEVELCIGDRYR